MYWELHLLILLSFLISFYASSLSPLSIPNSAIDEQLYSRQILVYGKGAQRQLQAASIIIYGSGPIAAEVLKNLVLAGIGRITLLSGENNIGPSPYLTGSETSLLEYAKSLNPQVEVRQHNNLLFLSLI